MFILDCSGYTVVDNGYTMVIPRGFIVDCSGYTMVILVMACFCSGYTVWFCTG